MMHRVFLFDIDGTLIRCGGAGGKSLLVALKEEFQLPHAEPVPIHGRTDLGIINQLLSENGIECNDLNRARLCVRYYSILPTRLQQLADNFEAHILPGIESLLESLIDDDNSTLGLLTGNMPTSAKIKLEQFSLWQYFEFGVFGHMADHRPRLAEPAMKLIEEHVGRQLPPERVTIIGDTTLDVELAKVMGSRCLAVCTGGSSADELTAAGADLVLNDLAQTELVVDWLRG